MMGQNRGLIRRLRLLPALVMVCVLFLAGCAGSGAQQTSGTEDAAIQEAAQDAGTDGQDTGTPEASSAERADGLQELSETEEPVAHRVEQALTDLLDEDGSYTTKEDVSLYLYTFGRLPDNFITKKEAQALGWQGGSLEPYAPGKCIGGDYFGNYEGFLPEKKGREYHECDIDTLGANSRGAKRIVYSNDGQIYYTADHYASYELLYGEE